MTLDLPEGCTLNSVKEDLVEVILPYEVVDGWNCTNCSLSLEGIIIGENGRYQGSIRANSTVIKWQGKLPKNEQKAIKLLKDTLNQKINRHRSSH